LALGFVSHEEYELQRCQGHLGEKGSAQLSRGAGTQGLAGQRSAPRCLRGCTRADGDARRGDARGGDARGGDAQAGNAFSDEDARGGDAFSDGEAWGGDAFSDGDARGGDTSPTGMHGEGTRLRHRLQPCAGASVAERAPAGPSPLMPP